MWKKNVLLFLLLSLSVFLYGQESQPAPDQVYQITAPQLQMLKNELSTLKQEATTLQGNLLSLKLLSETQDERLNSLEKTLNEVTQKRDALQALSDSLEANWKEQIRLLSNSENNLKQADESLTQALNDSRLLKEALKELNLSLEKLKRQVAEEKFLIGALAGAGGIAVGLIIGLMVK